MLATVATVVGTHDLAKGVLVGVLLSGVFFTCKVAKLFHVRSTLSADGKERTYHVDGQIFFASAESTAVGALDKIVLKHRRQGVEAFVIGVNEASAHMLDRFALHDKEHAASADTEEQRPRALASGRLRWC